MGLAVLPSRLKEEIRVLSERIIAGEDLRQDDVTAKHADWVEGFLPNYNNVGRDNIEEILKAEIGKVFAKVLEHAGVYKRNENGMNAFLHFAQYVNEIK